ncbi:MAG: hypothetical protein HYR71_02320, partial [Chloroflexi bacterium]|nr:hypothetical protein [Chloroflexota bacterium]
HYGQMALSHVYGLMGDFGSAHQWLDAAAEDIEAGGSSSERGQLALCRVRLAVDQGRLADALDGAATATALLRQGGDKHLEALAEFHLAHVLILLNRQDEAVPHLTRVAGLLAVLGYDHFIVIEGRRAALTLQFASGLPDVGHAFSRIFDRLRPSQAPAVGAARGYGVAAPATAPTLAVYTLGDERFAVADVPGGRLEPTPSLRPQIRELALFLLTRYPKGARQDEVLDLIWPNRSFERAKGALHVAITSIRNTLCPLTYVNGSYTLAPERLWYDVLEFERALAAARRASSPRERITWLEQATKLYGGDYLQRLDAPWALEEQQRLRRLYFDALVALGQACYDEGDLPAALRAYEKAISVEPYQEVAWHGAMLTELRIGNRAAARNRYEELRRLLASELGAKPSIELQALYHQISG